MTANGYRDEPDSDVEMYSAFLTTFAAQIEADTREDGRWILRSEQEPRIGQWILLQNEKILGNDLPAYIGDQFLPETPEKMYFPDFTKWKPLP